MQLNLVQSQDYDQYLLETEEIDYRHSDIKKLKNEIFHKQMSEIEIVRKAFEFVRDEIAHSWDIQSKRVTKNASEVLKYREGICYAKSNLLAALLRSMNIPTGFCYQRLTLGDTPDTGYCIHALNAVYLKTLKKWIRVDARGNKEGIQAEFSVDEEKLAFNIRSEYDEKDYSDIHANPHTKT